MFTVYFSNVRPSLYLRKSFARAAAKLMSTWHCLQAMICIETGMQQGQPALRDGPERLSLWIVDLQIVGCLASGSMLLRTGAIVNTPVGQMSRSGLTVCPVLMLMNCPRWGSVASKSSSRQSLGSKKDCLSMFDGVKVAAVGPWPACSLLKLTSFYVQNIHFQVCMQAHGLSCFP